MYAVKTGTSHPAISFLVPTTSVPSVNCGHVAVTPSKSLLLNKHTETKIPEFGAEETQVPHTNGPGTVPHYLPSCLCFRRQLAAPAPRPSAVLSYFRLDREIRYTFTDTGIKELKLTQTVTSTGERYQLDSFVVVKVPESSD